MLSYAHGLATAVAASGDPDRRIVAVIGDGSMTGGMAYEAMNNAGALDSRMLVVLNDNGMSIAPGVGALTNYLSWLVSTHPFLSIRDIALKLSNKFPKTLRKAAERVDEYARGMVMGGTLFEELGFYYVGPIDGHNFDHLLPVLRNTMVGLDQVDRSTIEAAELSEPFDLVFLAEIGRDGAGDGEFQLVLGGELVQQRVVRCLAESVRRHAPVVEPIETLRHGIRRRVDGHRKLRHVAALELGDLARALLLHLVDAQDRVQGQESALDAGELGLDPLLRRVDDDRAALAENELLDFDETEQLAVADGPGVDLVDLPLTGEKDLVNAILGAHGTSVGGPPRIPGHCGAVRQVETSPCFV